MADSGISFVFVFNPEQIVHLYGAMNRRQVLRHTAFWLVYFVTVLFYELFLPPNFMDDPSWDYFNRVVLSQAILLPARMLFVYYILYFFIPRWNSAKHRLRLAAEGLVLLTLTVLLNRLLVQQVIWVYVYGMEPHGPVSLISFLARCVLTMFEILQVAGIAATIKLFRMRMVAAVREKAMVQEKLTAEIRHLKAQVNPHFLFNALNSIFSLARTRSEKTPDVVLQLSEILRYMLYESGKKYTSVAAELKIISDYIALQQLRFGERLHVETTLQVDDDSQQVAPLLLLPLVENAFKHGTANVNGNVLIRIQLTVTGSRMVLQISNPCDAQAADGIKTEGIGLANIRRQLELLYTDYSFIYGRSGNLFEVRLELNLKSYAAAELFDH